MTLSDNDVRWGTMRSSYLRYASGLRKPPGSGGHAVRQRSVLGGDAFLVPAVRIGVEEATGLGFRGMR